MSLILFDRMWDRAEMAKSDSDTAYFHELMLLGELAFKASTVAMIAAVQDDKDRLRYQACHTIVRADGLGDWAMVLDDVLNGPPLQFLASDAFVEQRELTQRVTSDSWQYAAVEKLHRCLGLVDPELQPLPKHDGRRWFHLFVRLRNKTRAHGMVRPELASKLCPDLHASIKSFTESFNLFKREWTYLHRNLSGKYRVADLGNGTSQFDHLKSSKQEHYGNGIYIYLGEPRLISLLKSNSDLDDFYLPNGDFTDTRFECVSYITADKVFEPRRGPPRHAAPCGGAGVVSNR